MMVVFGNIPTNNPKKEGKLPARANSYAFNHHFIVLLCSTFDNPFCCLLLHQKIPSKKEVLMDALSFSLAYTHA